MKSLNVRSDYPMLCQLKFTPTGFDKATGIYSGTGVIDLTTDEPVKLGDDFQYNNKSLVVEEVIEQREAKGKHPIQAIWQRVRCSYTSSVTA